MIFSLSVVPMMGLAGVAIDYAAVSKSRTSLQGIADAAVLYSVSDQVVKPNVVWSEQKAVTLAAAKKEYESLVSGLGLSGINKSVSYDATIANSVISVKLCYVGGQSTTALNMVGVTEMSFAGCAQASSAPPTYVSVYALVDASSSMGIGASNSDRTLMQSKLGCVFACHTTNWNSDPNCSGGWNSSNTKCAKKIGAITRFDVVRNALIKVADQATVLSKVPGQYRIGVYKFSNYMTKVQASTTNMSTVKASLQTMEPDALGSGTNFSANVADFIKELPANGDGKSADSPRIFVMILTDGIASNVYERPKCYFDGGSDCNLYGTWTGDPRWVTEGKTLSWGVFSQAFHSKYCTAMKDKGVTVLTLETEFNSSGTTDSHMQQVDYQLRPTAHTELQKCASMESLAFSANQGADVDRAIGNMFTTVMEKARITR